MQQSHVLALYSTFGRLASLVLDATGPDAEDSRYLFTSEELTTVTEHDSSSVNAQGWISDFPREPSTPE